MTENTELNFRLADNNENYSLREYNSTSFSNFWVSDDAIVFISRIMTLAQFIKIDDGYITL